MIKPRQAEAVFKAVEEKTRHRCEHEIDESHDEEDLRVFECFRCDDFPFARQLDAGDHVCERGVFDQVDKLVAAPGQSSAERLGKDDVRDHPERGKADGLGRHSLPSLDGKEGAPHVFGMVGAAAKGKADHRSQVGTEIDPDVRKPEIPDEQLNHEREAAEDNHIAVGKSLDPPIPVNPQCAYQNSDYQATKSGWNNKK